MRKRRKGGNISTAPLGERKEAPRGGQKRGLEREQEVAFSIRRRGGKRETSIPLTGSENNGRGKKKGGEKCGPRVNS